MTETATRGPADPIGDDGDALAGTDPRITTAEQLRDVLGGGPAERTRTKDHTRLQPIEREWIAASPFLVVATAGADGSCDASPKGDPAGSVLVLDDTTVAIPERAGNKRADGYHNILQNPHVGLIFLVPGRNETLRINGRATLVSDAPWFDRLVVKGHRPVLAMVVEIEQIFLHCQKAFLRSELWKPETWHPEVLPSHACIVKETHPQNLGTLEELETYYSPERYDAGLYPA